MIFNKKLKTQENVVLDKRKYFFGSQGPKKLKPSIARIMFMGLICSVFTDLYCLVSKWWQYSSEINKVEIYKGGSRQFYHC